MILENGVRIILDLDKLQDDHRAWASRNFGSPSDRQPADGVLGLAEEVGELAHAELKLRQQIRGNEKQHLANARDAVGDIGLFLIDYCNLRGWCLAEILSEVWERVSLRDWVRHRADGHDVDAPVVQHLDEAVSTETYGRKMPSDDGHERS